MSDDITYTASRKKDGRVYTVTSSLRKTDWSDKLIFMSKVKVSSHDGPGNGFIVDYIDWSPVYLKMFPELEFVSRLQNCNSDGAPAHAESNGWYYLSGYFMGAGERFYCGDTSPSVSPMHEWSKHIRVDREVAVTLAEDLFMLRDLTFNRYEKKHWAPVKNGHARLIKDMAPRWKAEADTAREILKALAATIRKKNKKSHE